MNWESLAISIISNALFIAIATAIIKYFFDKKLESIKKDTAVYLMKYQTLHTKRADAVESIYTSLEKSTRYMGDVMNPIQLIGQEKQKERAEEAQRLAREFQELYSAKKIYLQPSLAKQLNAIDKEMYTLWSEFLNNHPFYSRTSTEDFQKWEKAWTSFTKDKIPKMLLRLEKEFRKLLGSDLS